MAEDNLHAILDRKAAVFYTVAYSHSERQQRSITSSFHMGIETSWKAARTYSVQSSNKRSADDDSQLYVYV